MSDTPAHEATEARAAAEGPGTALMPIQAGVVVWTRRQLLAASGWREVDDTSLAIQRIRKGIRSKVWKEAVRCAEVMLDIADVRKPREDEAGQVNAARRIEITVVESGRGAAADADAHGLGILPGGGEGAEA